MTVKKKTIQGSVVGRSSVMSFRSSACANEEAKLAGLVERTAALQLKQDLEQEEARIKAKLEKLALDLAIAEKRAKVKVLKGYEKSEDGMTNYLCTHNPSEGQVKEEQSHSPPINKSAAGSKLPSNLLQNMNSQVVRPRLTDSTDRQQFDKTNDGLL